MSNDIESNAPERGISPRSSSSDLLAHAARLGDRTGTYYTAEIFLMRQIVSTSSDLVLAKLNQEFRDAFGGMDYFRLSHEDAVRAYNQFCEDGEG